MTWSHFPVNDDEDAVNVSAFRGSSRISQQTQRSNGGEKCERTPVLMDFNDSHRICESVTREPSIA